MSATVCAACMAPLIPSLDICFDCDLRVARDEPRAGRRYRVDGVRGDASRLASALRALCEGARAEDVDWMARQSTFDVVADVTAAQEERIAAMLRACGTRFTLVQLPGGPPTGVRMVWDGHVPAKMGASVAIGVFTLWIGAPIATVAAVGMIALLAARATRFVPREVTSTRARADELLGPVDAQLLADLRAARASMSDPKLIELVRALVAHVGDLATKLREDASHLTLAPFARADAALTQLARSSLKLAVAADRARPRGGAEEAAAPYRSSSGYDEGVQRLRRIQQKLGDMRATVMAIRAGDPQSEALAESLRVFSTLHAECAEAFEGLR
jgi:hypothetical protein